MLLYWYWQWLDLVNEHMSSFYDCYLRLGFGFGLGGFTTFPATLLPSAAAAWPEDTF